MTPCTTIECSDIRKRAARIHRDLVLLQLMALGALVCVLGKAGPGMPALICWLAVVALALCSALIQAAWRRQEGSRRPPATRADSTPMAPRRLHRSLPEKILAALGRTRSSGRI